MDVKIARSLRLVGRFCVKREQRGSIAKVWSAKSVQANGKSRCRVLLENTPGAYALGEAWMHAGAKMAAFKDAPCIVPNNGHAHRNQQGSQSAIRGGERGQQLQWCMAEDVISVESH